MSPNAPFRSHWKVWLGIGIFLLVAALGSVGWVISLRDRKWAAFESRVDELSKEATAAPPLERLPLGRRLLPGNAWDDYLAAAASPPGNSRPRLIAKFIQPWLERDPTASVGDVESLVAEFEPRINLIRSGTCRERAEFPTPAYTVNGFRYPPGAFFGSSDLAYLCIGKARLLADGGNPSEALRLLVDVCLYGRDLAGARPFGGVSSSLHVMDLVFLELRDMLQSRNFAREDLESLGQCLEALDKHFPRYTNDLLDDLLRLGDLLRREDREDLAIHSYEGRTRRSWRSCYSTKLMAAATFSKAESLVQRAIALESQPWSVAGSEGSAICKEGSEGLLSTLHLGLSQTATQVRGNLRLLRIATLYRASGRVVPLDDPVGGPIRTRSTATGLLVWRKSLFGTPTWEPEGNNSSYAWILRIEVRR